MKKQTIHVLLILIAMSLYFFTACSSFSGPSQEKERREPGKGDTPTEKDAPSNAPDERKEFVYCISPPAVNLDPLHTFTSTEAQVYSALYEGLVTYNPFTLQPAPGIAERWETSENKTVYRFFIRDDARYSNGDYITAEHVRDTLLTLIDPKEDAEYANLIDVVKNVKEYRNGKIEDSSEVGIYAEEKRVLRFELNHPASHLVKVLCHHSFSPLHPKMREEGAFDSPTKLITNGPFFIRSSGEDEMLLKKNELYWDNEAVSLASIRVVYRDDEEGITEDFNKGEIHWTEAAVNYDRIADREALVVNHLFATSYYFFSAEKPPYNNPAVRRALALLLPWEEIRSSEYMYIPTSTLVPQIGSYPDIEGIGKKDVDTALSLLSKEGFPGGTGLPAIRIAIPEGEESRRIADAMKSSWSEKLDTEVSIEESSYYAYYDRLKERPFTVGTLTWIGDFADPFTFLGMWTSDSNLNISQYRQGEFDELIDEALPQTGEERYTTMSEAEKILLSGAVVMPIKHSPAFNVIDLEYIEGWYPNPLDIHPFKYVRFGSPSIPEGVVRDFSPGEDGRRFVRSPGVRRPPRSRVVPAGASTTSWNPR